jgi:hypothetical protein
MTQKPKRPPEWSTAIQDLNAKLQQLAERITRLEELVMGAVVDASDPENSPAPSPEAPPADLPGT